MDTIPDVISTISPLLGVKCSSGSRSEGSVTLQFSNHSFAADSMLCIFGCLINIDVSSLCLLLSVCMYVSTFVSPQLKPPPHPLLALHFS